jgi:hypothetical protein
MQLLIVSMIFACLALSVTHGAEPIDASNATELDSFDESGEVFSEAEAGDATDIEPFLVYTANLTQLNSSGVSGDISIFLAEWGLIGMGSASGLEANLTGAARSCSGQNGCGIRVDSGFACTDSIAQSGHYYAADDNSAAPDSDVADYYAPDPWSEIRYNSTDADGFASLAFSLNTSFGTMEGKPFIVHNSAGAGVACGILSRRLDAKIATLSPLNSSGVSGSVTIYSTFSRIIGAGWASGLEANLSDSSDGGSNCSATNGCGAHVHNGSACGSSAMQGGHLRTFEGSDPWTATRYMSTNSSGWAKFMFAVDSDNTDVLGKPFILHNDAGGRVSCGVLITTTTTTSTTTTFTTTTTRKAPKASHEPYLIYTAELMPLGNGAVVGEVTVFETSSEKTPTKLVVSGSAKNLEAHLSDSSEGGSDCRAENGCAVRVHSGTACTDLATQGGQLYDAASIFVDPWADIRYASTDKSGYSYFTFSVTIGIQAIHGRPFIVYNNAGERAACGILSRKVGTSAALSPLLVYPIVVGGVTIYSSASMIVGAGWAIGLEINLSSDDGDCTAMHGCGVHLHNGSDCSTIAGQGGPLKTLGGIDPWTAIRYSSTDILGRTDFVFSVALNSTTVEGKPFIVHDNAGGRVACGLLAAPEIGAAVKESAWGRNLVIGGIISAGAMALVCCIALVLTCVLRKGKSFEI